MKKIEAEHLEYKGESNGVHSWTTPSGHLITGTQIGCTLLKMRQARTQKRNSILSMTNLQLKNMQCRQS